MDRHKRVRWRNEALAGALANVRQIERIGTHRPPPTSQTEQRRLKQLLAEFAAVRAKQARVAEQRERYKRQASQTNNPLLAKKLRNHASIKRVQQENLAARMRQLSRRMEAYS